MKIDRIENVVARRSFQMKDGRNIEIVIGAPQPFSDDADYFCPFQMIGLGDARVYYAGGVDSYQALILALKKLTVHMVTMDAVKNGEVQWLDGSEPDLGLLPVP